MSLIPSSQLQIKLAIKAFIDSILNGNTILPDNLDLVDEDTTISFPNTLIYGGKIVPISYDKNSNTISIRS